MTDTARPAPAAPTARPAVMGLLFWALMSGQAGIAAMISFLPAVGREAGIADPLIAKKLEPTWKETLVHLKPNWLLYTSILVFGMSQAMISASFGAWLPAFLMRVYGMSPMQVGMTFGIAIMVAAPVGGFVAGLAIDIAKKLGRRGGLPLVGIIGAVMIGIPATLAPLAPNAAVFWTLFAVQLLVAAVPFPVIATAIARATPGPLMGKVISLRIFIGGLVVATVAPTLVATISDNFFGGDTGGPRAIGYAISVVSLGATAVALAAGALFWREYVKREDIDE